MLQQVPDRRMTPLLRRWRDLPLDQIPDRRSSRGWRRIRFKALISALFMGMLTARRSLPQVEVLTSFLDPSIRRLTGIEGRISDTKLRDFQQTLQAEDIRPLIHHQIKVEHRRGSLRPVGDVPFGVVALDGKCLAGLDNWGSENAQKVQPENRPPYGKVTLHRTTLISSAAAVCVDQRPVPGDTNEIGACPTTLAELFATYGKTSLFEMVMADAGNSSAAIASQIDAANYSYTLRIKEGQGDIYLDGTGALNKVSAELEYRIYRGSGDQRRTEIYRLYRVDPGTDRGYGWAHLRQWLRIEHETLSPTGQREYLGQRDWASNLPWNRLSAKQWLVILRRYWRCENNNHWTADAFFSEDAKRQPWSKDADTLIMLANLRMLALNVIALRRAMSRDPGRRNQALPWRCVLELALVWALGGFEYQPAFALLD